jgi:DNA invertase Pin-like site-specific DNA recombinase
MARFVGISITRFRRVFSYTRGAKTDRAELAKVIGRLEPDDDVVTRLDRLARSTRDLLNVIDAVTKRGAGFRSLKDVWADTTSPAWALILTALDGLAEFERELS